MPKDEHEWVEKHQGSSAGLGSRFLAQAGVTPRLLREALGDKRELGLEPKNLDLSPGCTTYQQVAFGKSPRSPSLH